MHIETSGHADQHRQDNQHWHKHEQPPAGLWRSRAPLQLLAKPHCSHIHKFMSPMSDRDSPGPAGTQLLAWLSTQKHKHIWSPGHFASKPGSIFTKSHSLSCAFVRSYTFVLPQVACTTWASEPWSHSSCWHLDLHTYTRIIEKSLERIFSNIKQSLLSTMHSHKSALNSKLYISNQPILFIFFSVFPCVFPSHLDPSLHLWFFT